MTLSCQQEAVTALEQPDGPLDGLAAVGDSHMSTPCHSVHNIVDDSVRILGSRIIGSDDGDIGICRCDATHRPTFLTISITATPEQHDQATGGQRSSGPDCTSQGVGRVRIIAEDQEPL